MRGLDTKLKTFRWYMDVLFCSGWELPKHKQTTEESGEQLAVNFEKKTFFV